MIASEMISKIGACSLILQGGLLILGVIAAAVEFGPVFGWSLLFSLLAGLVSFISGLAVSLITHRAKALGLSAASIGFALVTGLVVLTNIGFGV
jgi:hypothetical protein